MGPVPDHSEGRPFPYFSTGPGGAEGPGDVDERDSEDEDEAPETPPDEPRPSPVKEPPSEPVRKGPYVVHQEAEW
jgi:hypothetical protein